MFDNILDMAMFMLYIVILGLILSRAGEFTRIMDSIGGNWRETLKVLQMNG